MARSRLHEVSARGQSIWYDNIRRGLIVSGELQRLIDEDAVVGVTSNPAIFEKAIGGSADYDEGLRQLVRQGITEPQQVYEAMAIEDIQSAADILRPTWERTEHLDGYISLEVSPGAANDTTSTIAEARHLYARAARPNVMIKIPATAAGIPAIEQMIYEGVNINVTLIFSLAVYEQVAEAYIRGLEHRQREGLPVSDIASVASFFVSRVDTLVDRLLDERAAATTDPMLQEELQALHGTVAIANARLAYEKYQRIFHGPRFAHLAAAGARSQRCLWASTSTKNPAYRDVLYAEQLIGPETVDTMPPQTITAFQDHGVVAETVTADLDGARDVMRRLAAVGIEIDAVTRDLEIEGVRLFAEPFGKLLASTAEKVERLRAEMAEANDGEHSPSTASPLAQHARLGSYEAAVEQQLDRAEHERVAERLWAYDPTLWKADPAEQHEITDRLGWLTVMEQVAENLPRLADLREAVRSAGYTTVVLLGMGGSSLAPEVLRETFGAAPGSPDLHVLDSTDPATILHLEAGLDLARTLFIVASKSGGTIETLSQFRYFYEQLTARDEKTAGEHFLAITDPGTPLEHLAREHGFRAIFRNPPEIGGRYSALSYFGLVPAALLGVDVERLLSRAQAMARACQADVPVRENPGLWLGTVLATLAQAGRDKVTFAISPPLATFGTWAEQLLAESTGKEGKGLLPVEGEALGAPEVYGADRVFIYLRALEGFDPQQDAALAALEGAGHPVVRLALRDQYDLGQEFFRWEFATAVAGAQLGINAFDQPNVQESKDNTERLLRTYASERALPQPMVILQTQTRHVSIVAQGEQAERLRGAVSLQAALELVARQASAGDYIALLAYFERTPAFEAALQEIRLRLRDARRVATTLGYGPRFQHSTGQFHKGGPNSGVFLQLVATDAEDVAVPGQPYTFSVLKQAQALGDLQSLEAHGRRAVRIDLGADIASSLAELRQALDAAQLG